MAPDARRSQLIGVAAELVARHGVEGLQLKAVAEAARVSRPIVYRFFPNRRALVVALLEDFEAALTRRFFQVAAQAGPAPIEAITRVFVDAICDTIEEKGAAGWQLLDARGPDPEVAKIGAAILDRLVAPWMPLVAERTGASRREVTVAAKMLVAAGRAVLELWYGGVLSRAEAVRDATRGVSAILEAFTAPAPSPSVSAARARRRARRFGRAR